MRLFFGVGLPSGVKKEVNAFCLKIREKLPKMKWVEEENLHITMRFLGDVDSTKIGLLTQISEETSRELKKFPVTLGNLGAFPSPAKARVFWWGLREGEKECTELFNILETQLVKNGFEAEDKTFHPHITLARLKFPALLPLERLTTRDTLSFTASSFELYESTLTPKGPIYKIIERFNLG